MTYGTESVLPVDISLNTPRIEFFDAESSELGLRRNNDLLKETRDVAHLRNTFYQQKVANYFNMKSSLAISKLMTPSYENQPRPCLLFQES